MLERCAVGPIAILRLARPKAGNALNADLAEALLAALDEIEQDAAVRALVVTGSGDRFFCAGGDIHEYAAIANEADLLRVVDRLTNLFRRAAHLPIPVVAAIDGYALGAGAELALACDMRVMGRGGIIGFPQTAIGVIPTAFTFRRLHAIVGYAAAYELIALGTRLDARQAIARGLAQDIGDRCAALDGAIELCRSLCANGEQALATAKRLLAMADEPETVHEAAFRREFPPLWFSDFHKEAERSFAARRGGTGNPSK